MPSATPLTRALGRPPMAGSIIVALVAAGAVAAWLIGFGMDACDVADGTALQVLALYLLAFALAAWAIFHGASVFRRWLTWISARLLPERAARIVHWAAPLVVLVAIAVAVPVVDVPGEGARPFAELAVRLAAWPLAAAAGILAIVHLVQGIARHRDRARRDTGWLPDVEVAANTEAARWRHAWQLAIAADRDLRARRVPPRVVPFDVMTRPDEQVFLDAGIEYARFYATDATYVHSSGFYLGSPLFVAASLAGNAIGNATARAQAQRNAALQWREVQAARVLVTNERLLVHTATGWLTFDHGAVAAFHPEPANWCLVVEYHGAEPLRLAGMAAPHIAVLLASILRGPEFLAQHPAFAVLRAGMDAGASDGAEASVER